MVPTEDDWRLWASVFPGTHGSDLLRRRKLEFLLEKRVSS